MSRAVPLLAFAGTLACACADTAQLPETAAVGPNPTLPSPTTSLVPTVKVAPAKGWSGNARPIPASGLAVNAFATGFAHPRWVYVLPNGDVLVAETASPPKPDDAGGGLKATFMKFFMKKAGSAVPSANRITLLRDTDGDGIAELKTPFLENLRSPFGMALVGDQLYVANADSVVRYPYRAGETRISAGPTKVADLPAGRNHHWTKSLVASRDGSKLYVGVGSNSNIAEHGMREEEGRAAIAEIDARTGTSRTFASGLRNPVGIAWEPTSGRLWAVVNERDELGSDLVPDYLTSVTEHAFYGWPWSYYGQKVDERVKPPRPEMVARAVKPDYALGNHVAPLGLTFAEGAALGPRFASGAFVGEHGSWNRSPRSGYKVVFVRFENGRPVGVPVDVLTGFLNAEEEAQGRPVGVAIDKRGGLLVADDVGNVIWRVSAAR